MMEKSDESKLPIKVEPFGDWFKSFNHFFHDPPFRGFLEGIDEFFKQPLFPQKIFNVKVSSQKDKHLVTAELPGIRKEQIRINILGNTITISVKHQDLYTYEDDKNHIYRRGESFQHTSKTITIPYLIDEKRVKASYRDGLLKISIPKVKGKTIAISE
ncbi:Hsp20/alpha crystallin family protein [Mesobacillus maritimus]|uniref:Hsp20/alpha crystallin family protein n=1 Tax=Mesobacillus maritimus TaxID=1643336 RepID=A0ABS7K4D2_9BACI|nr:Hsp20/alpha crystallin family protein [Mesobacillus maritimus]MBY0097117.1 Hsp20/alpha crystallin family protein [Mesobacillus maritimus]